MFFLFNSDILLLGVDSWLASLMIFAMTGLAMIAMASAIQGWLIDRCTILERLLLLGATAILMFPALVSGFFMPYEQRWWGYLAGVGIFALVYATQRMRFGGGKAKAVNEDSIEDEVEAKTQELAVS